MAKELPASADTPAALRGVAPAKDTGSKAGLAALISAAVLLAAPFAAKWEGFAPRVYLDPAKIPTYCYGETQNVSRDPARVYGKAECMGLLRQRMARDYAPRIAACAPEVVPNARIFAALIDASYNAGPDAVCRSPMVRLMRAGQLKAGCEAFRGWYVTARDRQTGARIQLRGLVHRREDERRACLEGARP